MGEHQDYIVERSIPLPETGCWLWTGGWSAKGYGSTGVGGQNYAHRLSYQEFVGPIPEGLLVCHTCDVRPCCNPNHLFIGTTDDNQKDASKKGRMHRGRNNYNVKLTEGAVSCLRESELSDRTWSKMLGVSSITIRMARNGQSWRHV